MEGWETYLNLFWSFFKIGLFGFGGGYPMLSLVQNEVVGRHQWITVADFTDMVAISQATPGPIAFNMATYVGYTVTGTIGGAALATIAVSLPSLIFMTIVTKLYDQFRHNPCVASVMGALNPALIGLIAAAALLLIKPENFIDYISWIIFGTVLIASLKKISPILLIILSGLAGYLIY